VYRREDLPAGQAIAGPAVIEERESTLIVPPDASAAVEDQGNIVVTLRTDRAAAEPAAHAGERSVS
jgi:N-methylhydantoinase A/oxoprolinase/acetone carboxylase beta subunit